MKNYLLLSAFSAALLLGACKKSNIDPTAPIAQESIDAMAKQGNSNTEIAKCDIVGKELKGSMLFKIATNYELPCDCGSFMSAGTYAGVGNISHLGKTTSYFKPCIAPIFQGNALIGYHVGVQCGNLRAANGDYIYVDIKPYDLMFTATGAVGNVKVDIIGGTGRFKKATGKFKAGTTNDGMGNVTLDNINGSIDY